MRKYQNHQYSPTRQSLSEAARLLGGKASGGRIIRCPGPGHSPIDDSLHVWFDPEAPYGFQFKSHSGDDWFACHDHIKRLLGIRRDARPYVPSPAPAAAALDYDQGKISRAKKRWGRARSVVDTIAETYLVERRGIPLTDAIRAGHALRFHSGCPVKIDDRIEYRPALLAAITDIHSHDFDKGFRGFQATFLTFAGDKDTTIGRRTYGAPAGAVCKLSRDEDVVMSLGIAEGVETALSLPLLPGGQCHGVPVWATLGADALGDFPALSGIEVLWIAVDKEESGTGERAARQCADRWNAGGVECILVRVRTTARKSDLNDFIREGQGYG